MATGLKIALGLFVIAVITGLLGFGIIPFSGLFYARMAFFVSGTLFVPALLLGLLPQ